MKFTFSYRRKVYNNEEKTKFHFVIETKELELENPTKDELLQFAKDNWGDNKEINIEVYNDREEQDDNFSGLLYVWLSSSKYNFDYKLTELIKKGGDIKILVTKIIPVRYKLNLQLNEPPKIPDSDTPFWGLGKRCFEDIDPKDSHDNAVWNRVKIIPFQSKFSSK